MAEEAANGLNEIKLDADGWSSSSWADAIKELEGTKPVRPKKVSPQVEDETVPSQPVEPSELSADEMIDAALVETREARRKLVEFKTVHPYLIAPNIYSLWEDYLQETEVQLDRERNRVRGENTPAQ